MFFHPSEKQRKREMRKSNDDKQSQTDQKLVENINETDSKLELMKMELSSWLNKRKMPEEKSWDTSSHSEGNSGFSCHVNKLEETTAWNSLNLKNETCCDVDSPKFNSSFKDADNRCSSPEIFLEPKYDMSLLTEHKVERLLFKSFLFQVYGSYVNSSDDDSGSEKSCRKKSKIKKLQKTKSSKQTQGRKRNRRSKKQRLDSSFSNSDIETVDLDNTSDFDSSVQITHSYELDFDPEMYDWSEDFDWAPKSDSTHDVSVVCIDSTAENPNKNETIEIDSDKEVADKTSSKDVFARNNEGEQSKRVTNQTSVKSDFFKINNDQHTTKELKVWECPICYEESTGQEIVATVCGHVFCKMCLEIHITRISKFCPTCSSDLTDKPLITLYNI